MVDRQVTVAEPWDPLGRQFTARGGIFDRANQLYNQIPEYFPYDTTIGFNPQQNLAMNLQAQRALGGSGVERGLSNYLQSAFAQPQVDLSAGTAGAHGLIGGLGQGQAALGQIAGGGPNPYLDQQFQAASRGLGRQFQQNVLPGIAAQFGSGGRTGSGAHQQALQGAQQEFQTGVGDLAANIYGGAYDADQARRLQAAQSLQRGGAQGIGALTGQFGAIARSQAQAGALAPSSSALDYQNIDRLQGVGDRVSDLARQRLQSEMDRYNYYQQAPYQNLERHAALLGGSAGLGGGSQATTGRIGGPGGFQKFLGGAGVGAGIGGSFGGWKGALIGAGIGGLGSVFL